MKWLIIGGCGFIGKNLIKSLLSQGGNNIRVIDNLLVGRIEDLAEIAEIKQITNSEAIPFLQSCQDGLVEFVNGDIMDPALANKVAAGADYIVHLAANTGVAPSVENPLMDCMNNVLGTVNYLEAARLNKVKRFIFASSGAPVGDCNPPIHEEIVPHPVSPYGASKLAGEGYCSAYYRTFQVETVALRFGNVYGPGSGHKSSVVAKFIRKALAGKDLEIFGNGRQTRDFIYIDDLVRAICLAGSSDRPVGGEVFQIATNMETSVSDLVDLLLLKLQKAGIAPVKAFYGAPRLGDVVRNYSNTEKARHQLGWSAQIELAEGLERTISWFLANRS